MLARGKANRGWMIKDTTTQKPEKLSTSQLKQIPLFRLKKKHLQEFTFYTKLSLSLSVLFFTVCWDSIVIVEKLQRLRAHKYIHIDCFILQKLFPDLRSPKNKWEQVGCLCDVYWSTTDWSNHRRGSWRGNCCWVIRPDMQHHRRGHTSE